MKFFINLFFLIFFIMLSGCGYSPLLNSKKINFVIEDLNFEGERKINNYIYRNLKKYQNSKQTTKNYDINISSAYIKNIINKDDSGNPKNYKIILEAKVRITLSSGNEIKKRFTRNISLASQDKKISERELEKKYIKDLSNLLSEDIIFFLTSL